MFACESLGEVACEVSENSTVAGEAYLKLVSSLLRFYRNNRAFLRGL